MASDRSSFPPGEYASPRSDQPMYEVHVVAMRESRSKILFVHTGLRFDGDHFLCDMCCQQ
jgi:hypothetical protein